MSPALSSMRTWKCRWPGSTPSRCASARFVSRHSPSLPSISRTRTLSGCPSAFSCSGLSSTSVSRCKRSAPSAVARGALVHIAATLSSAKLGCCSAIEDCNGSPTAGPDEAGRRLRAWFRGECTARRLRLSGSGEGEDDLVSATEGREAERDPIDEGFEARLGRQDALLLLQRRG